MQDLNPNYLTRDLRDRRFDASFKKALRDGTPLRKAQIDAAITKMQNRTLRYRGEVISRTESINALRAGQNESIAQAIDTGEVEQGETTKEWDASGDARTRATHAIADGQKRDFDKPFSVGGFALMYPGDPAGPAAETIQCFLPGTPMAVSGLKAAIRREYIGEVVKIRAGQGVDLTVTLNHPILTSRGWIGAGEVVEGDKVFDCSIAGDLSGTEPNIANGVTTAEELYRSADALSASVRAPFVIVNFHGEIPDQDVDVVTLDGSLADRFDSPAAKFCDYLSLAETDIPIGVHVYNRLSTAGNFTDTRNTSGKMRHGRSLSATVRGCKGSASRVSLGYGWLFNSKIVKALSNSCATYANVFCNSVNRIPFTKKLLNTNKVGSPAIPVHLFNAFRNVAVGKVSSQRLNPQVSKASHNFTFMNSCESGYLGNGQVRKLFNLGEKFFPVLSAALKHEAGLERRSKPGFSKKRTHVPFAKPESRADVFNSFSASVEGFNVVTVGSIERFHYSGPVFNFETESGVMIAGNTICHNCRCIQTVEIDFGARVAKVEGFG